MKESALARRDPRPRQWPFCGQLRDGMGPVPNVPENPARIIHERLRPSRGSFPPAPSSDLLCDAPGIAVVGLPRPDEKSLAGTRSSIAPGDLFARDSFSFNDFNVFRPSVRELSGLASIWGRSPAKRINAAGRQSAGLADRSGFARCGKVGILSREAVGARNFGLGPEGLAGARACVSGALPDAWMGPGGEKETEILRCAQDDKGGEGEGMTETRGERGCVTQRPMPMARSVAASTWRN